MNNKALSNFIWRFLERWGAQGVSLVVGFILAKILAPEVYGTIALITVFISLLQVFVDSGLGIALIQKKEADDLDFSSVFWFNVFSCIILYILIFCAAPIISAFYNKTDLTLYIRVLGLMILISGIKNIQQAYVARNLLFKKFFFSTLGGTLGAAIVGVFMAYRGFGVWALIVQCLFNMAVDTLILWLTVGWKPKFAFSFSRFKVLFSYGWKMLFSALIDTFYNEMRSLIIGKFYSEEDLAFYTKGLQYPKYGVENINSSMNSVLLPVLSKKQDDKEAVKVATRKVIRTSSYVIWPMMVGLFVVADKFVLVLLSEKWMPAVPFLRILCFNQVLQPLQTTNLSVVKALGRSDLHLKMEIFKKCIAIIIVVCSAFCGVEMIAWGSVLYAVIASIINSYPNRVLINYSYYEQVKDISPFVFMSIIMGAIVYAVGLLPLSITWVFILQLLVGVLVYLLLSVISKIDTFEYLISILKKSFSKSR